MPSLSPTQMANNSFKKAYKARDYKVIEIGCDGDDFSFILRAMSFALEASSQGCAVINHRTLQGALDRA